MRNWGFPNRNLTFASEDTQTSNSSTASSSHSAQTAAQLVFFYAVDKNLHSSENHKSPVAGKEPPFSHPGNRGYQDTINWKPVAERLISIDEFEPFSPPNRKNFVSSATGKGI